MPKSGVRNIATRGAYSAVFEVIARDWVLMVLLAFVCPLSLYVMILGTEYWPVSSRIAFVIFGALPLVLLDLKKSVWLRVICTLPIKRDAIARCIWLSVSLPSVIVVAVGAGSAVIMGRTSAFDSLLAPMEMLMICAALTLAITFLPMEERIAIYPLLGLAAFLWVNLHLQLPSTWGMNGYEVATLGLLTFCAIVSFRYRERLLYTLSAVNVSKQRHGSPRSRVSFAPRTIVRVMSRTFPVPAVFLWAFFCLFSLQLGRQAGLDKQSLELRLYAWLLYGPIVASFQDDGFRSRLRVYKMLPLSRGGVLFWATKRTLAIFAAIAVAACCLGGLFSSVGLVFVLLAVVFWLGVTLVCAWWTLIGWDSIGVVLFALALLGMLGWHMIVYESAHRIVPLDVGEDAWSFWLCWTLLGLGLVCLGLGLQFLTLTRSSYVYKQRREM